MGYSPWGHKESDTTEQLTESQCTIMPSLPSFYYQHVVKVLRPLETL